MTLDGADKLRARLRSLRSTRGILGAIAVQGVREAKFLVPRRTANLSRTIRVGTVTDRYADILAGGRLNVGYAAAVEIGTRPHIIRPRQRKVLAWGGPRRLSGSLRSGGRPTHFAKFVRHPGSRARPYLVPGMKRAVERAGGAQIVEAWNRGA